MEFRTASLVGALAMGLTWAVAWAVPAGVIEAIDNIAPSAHGFTRQVDMWPQTLGLPGLVAGVVFSVLLLGTEGRRRFAEVPLLRGGAWGAVAGLLVGALVVWVVAPGLSEPASLAVSLAGIAAVLGALSGASSILLFRYVARRRSSAAGQPQARRS